MDNKTKTANLARGFQMATNLFANPTVNLEKVNPKDLAASVAELAGFLYQEQNVLFEGEDLGTAPAPAAKKPGGGWTGGSSSNGGDGPTEKQLGFAGQLVHAIQELKGEPEFDVSDIKGLATKGEASDAISALIEQRDSLQA